MLSFLMNQIVIAIKKENILTYLTLFDNRPESFTAFSETRLRDKELWDPGYTAKTNTILKKKLRRHLLRYRSLKASVTIVQSETCQ